MKKLTIVIPCHNEEGNVEEIYSRTREVLSTLPGYRHEHLFIDNASTDGTVNVLKEIAIRTISVVSSRLESQVPDYDRTKRDFLAWFDKRGILVDDSEANVEGATALGKCGVLFPQPWNSSQLSVEETLMLIEELVGNKDRANSVGKPE